MILVWMDRLLEGSHDDRRSVCRSDRLCGRGVERGDCVNTYRLPRELARQLDARDEIQRERDRWSRIDRVAAVEHGLNVLNDVSDDEREIDRV